MDRRESERRATSRRRADDKMLAEWFWSDRWMGSSGFLLPMEPRGFYREMLTQAWMRGAKLPNDHEAIRRAIGASEGEWSRCWPVVEKYWRVDGNVLVNDTQLEVYAEAQARLTRASEKGQKGARKRWGAPTERTGTPRSRLLSAARARATHTVEQWTALVAFCDAKCVKCGAGSIVKDHILPLALGGSDGLENIQPLCDPCNSSKGSDSTDYRRQIAGFDDWIRNALAVPMHSMGIAQAQLGQSSGTARGQAGAIASVSVSDQVPPNDPSDRQEVPGRRHVGAHPPLPLGLRRFKVWRWMVDELAGRLGDHAGRFDLEAWFRDLDASDDAIIPADQAWAWLQREFVAECRRFGLAVVSGRDVAPPANRWAPNGNAEYYRERLQACTHAPRCGSSVVHENLLAIDEARARERAVS